MNWARRHWLELLLTVLLAVPWLSLFGLGLLWLWQNHRVFEWAVAAAALGLVGWPIRALLRRRARARAAALLAGESGREGDWDTESAEAWAKVVRFAEETKPLDLDDLGRAEALARETVALVAAHFHPGQVDPMARVTLPEALLVSEQVAHRLRRWVMELPGASRIRISDALWLQRLVDRYGRAAQLAYDVGETLYRVARAGANPVQAIAQEGQRLAFGATGGFLGNNLRRAATAKLIHETGRAAIDLYSGRLRLSSLELAELARADAESAQPEAPPRLLLVGQANSGKTSLLNALAGSARALVGSLPSEGPVREHLVTVEGRPALNIADMPPLADPARFLKEAARADMILWVASATQPGRGPDVAALEALRGWAGEQRSHRPPPILAAMTHADLLRPAAEWAPPYDLDKPGGAKARSLRAARDSVAASLLLPPESVIPIALPDGGPTWNVDVLWERLVAELDSARRARNERLLDEGATASAMVEANRALRGGWRLLKSAVKQ
ncbi:GTPase family protein [Roseococcus pinisoli]|uniref:50S ribosome-binding GTPase n=1 Tax=Roseococcus pinisoli TaxID=2835040 RepID=A0ABS5Q9I9_9PROT|nr:GTPase domain-containing protein [Roseococcus pinisoli]MBS7810390.1 50S ribosome-binding GTPase [Roseococcus pinisoli]